MCFNSNIVKAKVQQLKKPQLFFISGLGADQRAFDRIELEGYEQTHLPWIIPSWNDNMHSYAKKMANPIMEAENPVVIGLSLGGMLASEMTTFIPHMRAILVSSIKSPQERSNVLRMGRTFPIRRLMHPKLMHKMTFMWSMARGKSLKKQESDHMIKMFKDQNDKFLSWAIYHPPKWRGTGDESRIHHIHGTADRMFPIKRIKNAVQVEGGSHLMVYTQGEEVTHLILEELKRIERV
jgi:pimeloyl-ACP methyl ester carboxylesterase